MVVSSANIYTNPDTTDVGKSFVNIEKSVGPKTDPCGMPYDTGSIPEGTPFTIYNLQSGNRGLNCSKETLIFFASHPHSGKCL